MLPPSDPTYTVPSAPTYSYGYINNRYVIIDPRTRMVVSVYE